jgi:hypothetical protein
MAPSVMEWIEWWSFLGMLVFQAALWVTTRWTLRNWRWWLVTLAAILYAMLCVHSVKYQ